MSPLRLIACAVAVALSLGLVACGSGEAESSTDDFQIDVPGVSTTTEGGTPAGGTGLDPSQPDTKENDLPPEPGSPQEAFENFCKQHPDACG